MANEADRMARAGNYVLGLMNDAERERAERDLERDALFRDAVLSIAERMRIIGGPAGAKTGQEERWKLVSAHLAEMPQMRGRVPAGGAAARTDAGQQAATGAMRGWRGILGVPAGRKAALVACLVAVFALGFLAGTLTPKVSSSQNIDTAGRTPAP